MHIMAIQVISSASADVDSKLPSAKKESISDFVKRQPKWLRDIWSYSPRSGYDSHDEGLVLTNI